MMFATEGKEKRRYLVSLADMAKSVGILMISLEQEQAASHLAKQASARRRTRREIWQRIRQEGLNFHLWQQKPYTVVDAVYQGTVGRGVTKWNHEDAGIPGLDWNSRRGIDIARGRAIKDLLDQLEARANGG